MKDSHEFGRLLSKFRRSIGLHQHQLAERLKRTRNTIGYWERGITLPEDRDVIEEMEDILQLTQDELDELLINANYAPKYRLRNQENSIVGFDFPISPYPTDTDFISWCEQVLQKLAVSSKSDKYGIDTKSFAREVLGNDFADRSPRDFPKHAPFRQAVEELRKLGMIEQIGSVSPRWKITTKGTNYLYDRVAFWESIWRIPLKAEQEKLLRYINAYTLSPRSEFPPSIPYVLHNLLVRDLHPIELEGIIHLALELEKDDFIRVSSLEEYRKRSLPIHFASTLQGLIWETRKGYSNGTT